MHCANFPRHLGRLINRCLIAHPEGADTIELAHWAYGEVLPPYARHNVRRHCLCSALHVLASVPGGSFGRCRQSREIIEIATPFDWAIAASTSRVTD